MSVVKSKRGINKFETTLLARQLAVYTLRITVNENIFDPKFDKPLTYEIMERGKNIFVNCYEANNTSLYYEYDKRKDLMTNAIKDCDTLLALIQLAQPIFHLKTKRIKYWGNLILEVKSSIKAWKKSDSERYKIQREQIVSQNVRLRSANRGNSNNTWNVNSSGNVNNNNAINANRFAPDCISEK